MSINKIIHLWHYPDRALVWMAKDILEHMLDFTLSDYIKSEVAQETGSYTGKPEVVISANFTFLFFVCF